MLESTRKLKTWSATQGTRHALNSDQQGLKPDKLFVTAEVTTISKPPELISQCATLGSQKAYRRMVRARASVEIFSPVRLLKKLPH